METLDIFSAIRESIEKVREFCYKNYLTRLTCKSKNYLKFPFYISGHIINQVLGRFNLKLIPKNEFEELLSYRYDHLKKWNSVGTLKFILENNKKFEETYKLFADDESRNVFDWFIKYRIAYAFLGEGAGEIFPSTISRLEFLKRMNDLKFDILNGLISTPNFIFKSEILESFQTWVLEQYNLPGKCEVSKGDYVIDGGAYKGETSLWFLSKGAERVYAFEPDPYNFSVLCSNIKRNKVSSKIIPVFNALSNRIGDSLLYVTGNGGSFISENGNKISKSITLDYFIEKEDLNRLDFIKLDVEGSELEVLEGAVKTIKKFKPKMAISIYHKPEDIITIPNFIFSILPYADFYLSHKSYEISETILFVNPRR